MKTVTRCGTFIYSILFLLLIAWFTPAHSADIDEPQPFEADELLVRFTSDTDHDTMKSISQSVVGATGIRTFQSPTRPNDAPQLPNAKRMNQWCVVELPNDTDLDQASQMLSADPRVEYVEKNFIVQLVNTPNDSRYPEMWNLDNIGQTGGKPNADIDAPQAWDIHTGSSNVVVAVIDTGIDYNHPDLNANMWSNPGEIPGNGLDDDNNGYVDDVHGYDFKNNDGNPFDDHGHGTHVAGTIAAAGNNALGVVGVAWNVRLMAIKFLNFRGIGTLADAIDSVLYATQMGARLSNNSWSGGGRSIALQNAIAAADEAGILFVAAAANSNKNTDVFPAYPASFNLGNIISVAATDHNDNRATFSNYGANSVDLAAPGVNILSTMPLTGSFCCANATGYGYLNGTSMASPHVAGAAALLFSAFPDMTHRQVKDRILETADPVASLEDITVTGGRLNIAKALNSTTGPAPFPVDNLGISDIGNQFVQLTWTSTGMGDDENMPHYYDIRYSTSPINHTNFYNAQKALDTPTALPVGTVETYSVTMLKPETRYYFAVKVVDAENGASALSNVVSVTTKPQDHIDYVITKLIGPDNGFLSRTISVEYTACNIGEDPAPETIMGFYLIKDNNKIDTHHRIGERQVPALDANSCHSESTSLYLEANIRAGNYHLKAIVDEEEIVSEYQEDNNMYVGNLIAIADYIDMTIKSLSGTQKIAPRSVVKATDIICSLGTRKPGHSYAALYISENPEITKNATPIDTHSTRFNISDDCVESSYWGFLPVFELGTYYIGSIADYRNEVEEGDEDNNVSAPIAIVVTEGEADLVVKSVKGQDNAVIGDYISVAVSICNEGIRKTSDFKTALYLLEDAQIDAGAIRIGNRNDVLYNEHCSHESTSIGGIIPPGLTDGSTYYLGVFADSDNDVVESDETNNWLISKPITVNAPSVDLAFTSFSGPSNAVTGDSISVTGTLCDQGHGTVPYQFGTVYLSTDDDITTDDRQVGWQYNSGSQQQCTANITNFVTIPADLPPGQYYWGVIADTFQAVVENNEDNNNFTGNMIDISAM